MSDIPPKRLYGFAAMSPERRKEIASLGGKAIPAELRAFSRSKELAAAAGRVGGKSVDPADRVFSRDRELARVAASAGGKAKGKRPKP